MALKKQGNNRKKKRKVRDGSLIMRMTGSDKKCPGHEKFLSRNDGLYFKAK